MLLLFVKFVDNDFRCNECNRTLSAGMTSLFFLINIFDDNILELDEDFMLTTISTVVPSNSGIRVITGSPESTVVVIEDNDCELCYACMKYSYIINRPLTKNV